MAQFMRTRSEYNKIRTSVNPSFHQHALASPETLILQTLKDAIRKPDGEDSRVAMGEPSVEDLVDQWGTLMNGCSINKARTLKPHCQLTNGTALLNEISTLTLLRCLILQDFGHCLNSLQGSVPSTCV